MVLTSVSLIVTGIACLLLCGYILYSLAARDGQSPTLWTATENRSTITALALVTLFVFGGALLVKGILT